MVLNRNDLNSLKWVDPIPTEESVKEWAIN